MSKTLQQIKFNKIKKGKLKKFEFKTQFLTFGMIGLKSVESGIINFWQIEAAKQSILRKIKKKGKIWIKISPNLSITSKPTGAWMGKGKGPVAHWSAWVSAGTILFEICSNNVNTGIDALKSGGKKLPVKTIILY